MIELVAVDLDGTLINSDHQISEMDIESLMRCRQKNIIISIVTGRSIWSVGEITDMLGLKGLHLASSGSVIVDEKHKIHKALKVTEKITRKIVSEARKWGRGMIIHASDGFLKYEEYFPNLEYIDENRDFFKEVGDLLDRDILNNTIQMTALINEEDKFDRHLREIVGESAKVRRAGPYFLNILNKKAGKLFGIKEILKETGIKRENLMVIGDTEVDLGIIKYAGVGVAMRNASQSVKDSADYITSDNNNSGVSEAIKKFILDHY